MPSQTSHVAKMSIFLAQLEFLIVPIQGGGRASERKTLKAFPIPAAVSLVAYLDSHRPLLSLHMATATPNGAVHGDLNGDVCTSTCLVSRSDRATFAGFVGRFGDGKVVRRHQTHLRSSVLLPNAP